MVRPIRFLAAGMVNTAFGLAFYPLLVWNVPFLHRHYLMALAIAQAVCLVFAYLTHKLGVFRTRGRVAQEFGAFSAFYIVNYAANWLTLPVLVEVAGIQPVVAQTAFTCVLIVGSWFWHSRVTFRVAGERP
ncbi:GtrA family protein [Sphingosinicella terrae]|uniref:GtrA family protein n=1 Tax=Sphingosinicella terrae TaxID=2172047 RepID=UPI000E0CF85B|nr:GtrA family protein [Sphingosinicella terrae]